MQWDLSPLYTSFEDPALTRDFEKLENILQQLLEQTANPEAASVTAVEQVIGSMQELQRTLSRLNSYFYLTQSVDSDNQAALDGLSRVRAFSGELALVMTRVKLLVKDLDIAELAEQSELVRAHAFVLSELQQQARRLLSEKEEILLAKLRNTGSTAFSTLQGDITSNLMIEIEIDGERKSLPLPAIRNLAYSPDAELRKRAFEAELAAYPRIEKSSAAALNAIKGEVITVAELKGYADPLDQTMEDSRMDRESLDALLEAMQAYLPDFRRYLRRKAELLGHTDGLPFYDLFAPVGENNLEYTYPEAMAFISQTFRTANDDLADLVDTAYQDKWIDVEPRAGKRGGAFCSNLHVIGQSRIMSNFSGSFSNMSTLAHELGHAYHGYRLAGESNLNASYPMPLAETASIFNESLITQEALKTMGDDDALAVLEDAISGATQVIVDIYSRYLFETELFEKRKDRTLQAAELCEMMLAAQRAAYGDGLDPTTLHPYMWINKPHYYSAARHFYNFPYAFGLLLAKGFIAEYEQSGPEFFKRYDEFLRLSGQLSIADAAQAMDIDVRDSAFFKQSLDVIVRQIDEFIERTDHLLE